MAKGFRGGLVLSHIRGVKDAAMACAIKPLSPAFTVLSLRQRGEWLFPCVSEGDKVRIGDKVAEDPLGNLPPLHSGVSGTVTAINRVYPVSDGGRTPCVLVENDGRNTMGTPLEPLSLDAEPSVIVQRMFDGGLVGLGGGGFPTYRKYRGITAKWLLINGCECEPYLAADARLCIEQPDLVAEGARYLAKAAGVKETDIRLCVESVQAAKALETTGLSVVSLKKRYPQGSERQLIQAVLGIRLPDGVLPSQQNIMVSNAATAAAMAEAARGWPLTHRVLTVSGAVVHPVNLLLPIGTPFEEAAAQVTLATKERVRYIAGGPMTGHRLTSLKSGIPKTCGGLTMIPADGETVTPCIRCGACVRVCPAALMPFLIEAAALAKDTAECLNLRTTACLSCGCCSFVCPAKRPLAARITAAKRYCQENGA